MFFMRNVIREQIKRPKLSRTRCYSFKCLLCALQKKHFIVYSHPWKNQKKEESVNPALGQFFRRVVSINTIKGKNEPIFIYREHFFSFIRINL